MNTDEENQTIINPSIEMSTSTIIENKSGVVISDKDKENFFKSILSDKAYEESVPLFDGTLELTFRAMSVQENSDIVTQIGLDRNNDIKVDNDAYLITLTSYRMALSLAKINDQEYSAVKKEGFTPRSKTDTYILARMEPMLSWSTPKLSTYIDAFKVFENKLIKLAGEVQNRNFWKASA